MAAALNPSRIAILRWLPAALPKRTTFYAYLAGASFISFILARFLDGPASKLFAAGGVSACGWAWLLTRALFDPAPRDESWPRVTAVLLASAGILTVVAPADGFVARLAHPVYELTGSAALLLTFVAPLSRYRSDLPANEKRFRVLFLAVYSALIGISVIGLRVASVSEGGALDDFAKAACALAGLSASIAAVGFRRRNPLALLQAHPAKRAPSPDDTELAEHILSLLRDEQIDRDPDLRLTGLAGRLGQPEHRVSQAISTALGFANFNRLINYHRIEHAKMLLAEPGCRQSILQIAFDCGFGSIGPFNRSFKAQEGVTPRAFRAARRSR